jgi:hypothetical protein
MTNKHHKDDLNGNRKTHFSFFEKQLRNVDLSIAIDFAHVAPYSPGPKEFKGSNVIKGF